MHPIATANHIYDKHGIKIFLDHIIHNNADRWHKALSNEFGRLTQSNDAALGCTEAINFIHHSSQNAKVTYASFVCNLRPLKSEQWRVRLVNGSGKLIYQYDTGSPTANLLETKCYLRF